MSREVLWQPTEASAAATNMTRFMDWLQSTRGVALDDYDSLHSWSVERLENFWESIWEYFHVRSSTPYDSVLAERVMPGARWFAGAHLNFAEHMLDPGRLHDPAIVFVREDQEPVEIGADELRRQVAALAECLRAFGVQPGDRVCAYLPNVPETIVGFLATASVGAIWSVCAPDFGTQSVIDRFVQLEPKVLIAADGYCFGGRRHDRREVVARLRRELPSARELILLRTAFPDEDTPAELEAHDWEAVVAGDAEAIFAQVPFEHPLWVLFSSGTTGVPKGIVQSHGGILLEQLKAGSLCLDLRPGDRFYFFTSTAWVVWNLHICSLLAGAIVVLYDGSPVYPDPIGSFRVAARTGATSMGSGAAYLSGVRRAGHRPGSELDLSALRHLVSTGSPLPDVDYRWVTEAIGSQVRLDSASGGTDVCSAFVGGSPLLPVFTGRMSCSWLGCAVESWDGDGRPQVDQVGELVITEPMPSMPTAIWGDEDGSRLHDAYFAVYEGVWRHGDWIEIAQDGSLVISGRSDSTLNRLGVRMGSADIYGVVEQLDEVADSIVLGVELPDGEYWMPLFIVPAEGTSCDEALRGRIVEAIREGLSRRHVPDEILQAPAVPRTLTGKKLEVPIKRLMQGEPLEKVVNLGAVDQPDVMEWFAGFARDRAQPTGGHASPAP